MGHDATKVLMGSSRSSVKEVDNRKGTIAAGLRVCLKSDDTITTAIADGAALGISMGGPLVKDLARTAIARKALALPIQLTADFTPVIGAQVNISDTTGKAGTAGGGFTAVNAVYASGVLTGVMEDASEVSVALIDFIGGL
jgi:hypothetical protein